MVDQTLLRKDQVLAVAEKLFAHRGFQATSVRDLADALNMKGGSLYAHIESKDDLLWEIVSRAADRFFDAVVPIAQSDLLTIEKLRRLIVAHIGVITSDLNAAAVYSTEWRHLADDRRVKFLERRDTYERIIRGLVRDAIQEGTFGEADEKFATLLILSSINWVYQWYRPDGPMSSDEIGGKLSEMLFNGLKRGGR